MTGGTTASLENAGIMHRRSIAISSAQVETLWYETKVSLACGTMNIWGK